MRKIAITLLIISACTSEATERREAAERKQAAIDNANFVMENLEFVRERRTGLCFAYEWQGFANGGPMLAWVPCSGLEKLLVNP